MTHERVPHTSHWGASEAEVSDGTVGAIHGGRVRSGKPAPFHHAGNGEKP